MSEFNVLNNPKTNSPMPKVWADAATNGIVPASYISGTVIPG